MQLFTCSISTGMCMESPQEDWSAFICTAQILDRGLFFGYGALFDGSRQHPGLLLEHGGLFKHCLFNEEKQ